MASTKDIFYFPTSLSPNASIAISQTKGCDKRNIAAINNNAAEWHLVFPQVNAPAVTIRFATETARNNMYVSFMADYGNSVAGS